MKIIANIIIPSCHLLVFICFLLSFVFYFTVSKLQEIEAVEIHDGEKIYHHYCSPCHGILGEGNGFNAKNLDPRPANHSNADFMSKRSNKALYNAISGGGRAVGRSTLMPPWGDTFSDDQIRSLVHHLRKLCRCKGE